MIVVPHTTGAASPLRIADACQEHVGVTLLANERDLGADVPAPSPPRCTQARVTRQVPWPVSPDPQTRTGYGDHGQKFELDPMRPKRVLHTERR